MISTLSSGWSFITEYIFSKRWFTVIISLVLTILIFIRIDAAKVWATILTVNLFYYLIGLGLILIYLAVKSKRWQLLLRSQQITCSTFKAFTIYNIGSFYGLLTPGRIGDFAKIYYLSPYGGSGINAFWGTLYDRILDLVMLVIINILALFLLKNLLPYFQEFFLFISVFLLGSIIIGLISVTIAKNKSFSRYKFDENSFLAEKSVHWIILKQKFVQPILRLWSIPIGERIFISLLTVIIWVILFGAYYAFAQSLNINLNIGMFVGVMSIAMLAANLPISFSGIGVRDLSLIILLALVGIDESRAVSLSLLVLSTYLLSAFIGVLALLFESQLPSNVFNKANRNKFY
jgi:uncharacterized protein (TIRG00374 family)